MIAFKVGDRVGYISPFQNKVGQIIFNMNEELLYGIIKEINSKKEALIQWDNNYCNNLKYYQKPFPFSNLMLESEIKPKMEALEDEFNHLERLIVAKMEAAGQMIEEANQLAAAAGRKLHELYHATSPLTTAMDNAGWHTSSLSC